jgi:hypothetical protein
MWFVNGEIKFVKEKMELKRRKNGEQIEKDYREHQSLYCSSAVARPCLQLARLFSPQDSLACRHEIYTQQGLHTRCIHMQGDIYKVSTHNKVYTQGNNKHARRYTQAKVCAHNIIYTHTQQGKYTHKIYTQ